MRIYGEAAQAALDDGTAIVSGAVFIDLTPAFRVWGGYGVLTIEGETFLPIGDRGLVAVSGGSLGAAEQGAELTLSGVDPDVLALVDVADVRGAAVVIWELVFDGSGTTLLAANVDRRGRIDRLVREDIPGGPSIIRAMVEGAARGLGRRSGRMRTDADQRLFLGTDGGFSRVSYAADKTLNWGGKPPERAGAAIPGAAGPSTGGSSGRGRLAASPDSLF